MESKLLLGLLMILPIYPATGSVRSLTFHRCPRGFEHNGQQFDKVLARSFLDCAIKCSQTTDCEGVNVCPFQGQTLTPSQSGQTLSASQSVETLTTSQSASESFWKVVCGMIGERKAEGCTNLVESNSSVCFFMQRKISSSESTPSDNQTSPNPNPANDSTTKSGTASQTTTESGSANQVTTDPSSANQITTAPNSNNELTSNPTSASQTTVGSGGLVCENGGTLKGFPGSEWCQCADPYAGTTCSRYLRDCTETNATGVLTVQPVSAPQPFQVFCAGQKTYFAKRTTPTRFDLPWDQAKLGFGDVTSADYVISLDNIYHLTKQATYQMKLKCSVDAPVIGTVSYDFIYANLTMNDESTLFALTFVPVGIQFPVPPLTFCTTDRDCYNCAGAIGGGWYNSDCEGFWPYGKMQWTIAGSTQTVTLMEFSLTRTYPLSFN